MMKKSKMAASVFWTMALLVFSCGAALAQNASMNKSMSLSSMDKKFMMEAAMGGQGEIAMARLALQKSSSDSVKQYAQQMIDDHTKAGDQLMQVATMKSITLPTEPDAKHKALLAKMQNLSGAAFDSMYVKMAGVQDHEKMEKLFQSESSGGKDMDAKSFASSTLPTVQQHLKMARDMMMSMNGKSGKSGSTM
jgi:putative membrane protein